jgi:hypothetical protein
MGESGVRMASRGPSPSMCLLLSQAAQEMHNGVQTRQVAEDKYEEDLRVQPYYYHAYSVQRYGLKFASHNHTYEGCYG